VGKARCKHAAAVHTWRDGEIVASRCSPTLGCGEQLPLGPANDDGDEAQIEIRAAYLAAEMNDPGTIAENNAWWSHPNRDDDDPWSTAGYLARELATHDVSDQRDANAWPWDPTRPVAGQYEEQLVAEPGSVLPYEGARPDPLESALHTSPLEAHIPLTAEAYELWRDAEPDIRDEDGPEVEQLLAELDDEPRERTCTMPGFNGAITMTVSGYDPKLGKDHPNNQPLWWLSWNQIADPKDGIDTRPVAWPPPIAVLGFWRSGYAFDESYATVVALVRAPSADDAQKVITAAWSPGVGEWRFCDEHDASKPPGDRFPPCEWSIERGTWPWPTEASRG